MIEIGRCRKLLDALGCAASFEDSQLAVHGQLEEEARTMRSRGRDHV